MRLSLSKKKKDIIETFEHWVTSSDYETLKDFENSFNSKMRRFSLKLFGIGYILPVSLCALLSPFIPMLLPLSLIGVVCTGPILTLLLVKNPPFKKLEHWKIITKLFPKFKREVHHYETMLNNLIEDIQKPETQKIIMDFVLHAEREGIPSYTFSHNIDPYYQYYHDKVALSILNKEWTHLLLQIDEIKKHYEKIKYRKDHASAYQLLRAHWNEEEHIVEETHWWKK